MILVVDNTKNLNKAFMTPKLLKCLDQTQVEYKVVSTTEETTKALHEYDITGAILSGGPMSLAEEINLGHINKNILVLLSVHKPVLGICFGLQIIGACYGGTVDRMSLAQQGEVKIKLHQKSKLFENWKETTAFRYHQDCLTTAPFGFTVTATSDDGVIQAIECPKLQRYAVQFHPEGLESSQQIIRNFVRLL